MPLIRPRWKRVAKRFLGSRLTRVLLLAILSVIVPALGMAAPDTPTEDQVKAAFIFNFLKFVQWPADGRGEEGIGLCIMGTSPLTVLLGGLDGKDISGRPLRVIAAGPDSGFDHCRALYFSGDITDAELTRLLGKLKGEPVLTISERKGFIDRGGIIELTREANKIRFKINLGAARAADLTISSKLLRLATEIAE